MTRYLATLALTGLVIGDSRAGEYEAASQAEINCEAAAIRTYDDGVTGADIIAALVQAKCLPERDRLLALEHPLSPHIAADREQELRSSLAASILEYRAAKRFGLVRH
jgi:hypothetical protein